jgi:hypothetical protein
MIATNRMEPGLIQPSQDLCALRTTIYEIANRKEPVDFSVKVDVAQGFLELGKMAMNITDSKIPAR